MFSDHKLILYVTRLEGLEPSTPDFGDLRSTN
jgi:hypothetical protein